MSPEGEIGAWRSGRVQEERPQEVAKKDAYGLASRIMTDEPQTKHKVKGNFMTS
jgi:hypothetical protein